MPLYKSLRTICVTSLLCIDDSDKFAQMQTEKSNRATDVIPKMRLFWLEFFDVQKIA